MKRIRKNKLLVRLQIVLVFLSSVGMLFWVGVVHARPQRPESNQGGDRVKVYPNELETPLGMLVGACKAKYTKLGLRKLKPNHIFVAVFTKATREYPAKSIIDWILIDQDGKKHRCIAVISDEVNGILFGVEGLAAYGSPKSPKTTRLIYEIPKNFRYLELHINGQGYVRFWPKKDREDS